MGRSGSIFYRSLFRSLVVAFLAIGVFGFGGCHQTEVNAQTSNAPDPADVNMAPVDPTEALSANTSQAARAPGGPPIQNESQQRADEYRQTGQQAGAPTDAQQAPAQAYPQDQDYPNQSYPAQNPSAGNEPSDDQVDAGQAALEADEPPPTLPQYEQPEAPAPNYMWTPGYWYWGPWGYYWVPGAWVMAPYPGALWTPGYWFFVGPYYRWHPGYWGLHIGFYGGINYGCGYTGYGYYGGYWRGNSFYYNRAVNRVNVTRITNVYDRNVVVNNVSRVSYNGGRGGLQVQPRPTEVAAMREARTPAMSAQVQSRHEASQNRAQFYSENRGRPAMTVAAHPLVADHGIARPQPGPVRPAYQPSVQQARPGQSYGQPTRPEVRPVQPGESHVQPVQPSRQPYVQPMQPEARPQPQAPRPEYRPGEPNVRPVEPRPQSQPQQPYRPAPQQEVRPQPQQQYHPQPQPQYRPEPQQQYRPQPQQQYHPQPEAQPRSMPEPRPQYQPQPHPAPQYQPRPQESHPAQQPRESQQPHGGGSERYRR